MGKYLKIKPEKMSSVHSLKIVFSPAEKSAVPVTAFLVRLHLMLLIATLFSIALIFFKPFF